LDNYGLSFYNNSEDPSLYTSLAMSIIQGIIKLSHWDYMVFANPSIIWNYE